MNIQGDSAVLTLEPDQPLRIERGRGVALTCLSGVLWVTQQDDLRDLYLGAADVLTLEKKGLAIVTALEPSVLRITDGATRWGALPRWFQSHPQSEPKPLSRLLLRV